MKRSSFRSIRFSPAPARWMTASALLICGILGLSSQTVLTGRVRDDVTGIGLPGVNIRMGDSAKGTVADEEGHFNLATELPVTLVFSYVGYVTREVIVQADSFLDVSLHEEARLQEVEILGHRLTERQLASPRSLSTFDAIDMIRSGAHDLAGGLALRKEIDLVTASLGFKVINTRGFNSTAPVRMLQLIDGVDNQSPGLNFSIGQFLGASELDLNRVEVAVGPAGPLYGPNAFNGTILQETRDPFLHSGLSAQFKAGERDLGEFAIRYAAMVKGRSGSPWIAFKVNVSVFRARDWEAANAQAVSGSRVGPGNPGGYNAVNTYGDETGPVYDTLFGSYTLFPGLGEIHRTGYRERDLVDYRTHNLKIAGAVHFRMQPALEHRSPEWILASSFSQGTTVYQGDNRFSLRDIRFFQHRIEFRQRDRFFLRTYLTHEHAGRSFDPYFTALRMQEIAAGNQAWFNRYESVWRSEIVPKMRSLGYPWSPSDIPVAEAWLRAMSDSLAAWHAYTRDRVDFPVLAGPFLDSFFLPGTPRYDSLFALVTGSYNTSPTGTRFFDRSALWHSQGEYRFKAGLFGEGIAGASFRMYLPDSRGTIFRDTAGIRIRNQEFGFYGGLRRDFLRSKTLSAELTVRVDKNRNMPWIGTVAAGVVQRLGKDTYLRASMATALRNPTLSDQYLWLNVGPATLAGHIGRVDSLITPESFRIAQNCLCWDLLSYFSIDPIRPEYVRTFEAGVRTRLGSAVDLDAGYYLNGYKDFLGYRIGLTADFPTGALFPRNTRVFRYTDNADTRVITQGFSLSAEWHISRHFDLMGNFSYNSLVKADRNDPIIPAFNTPRQKYVAGFSAHEIPLGKAKRVLAGFGVHYKWIAGFQFEGSPQFTGYLPSYGIVDAQVNLSLVRGKVYIKAGASNLLDNRHYESYGGPSVGRLTYALVRFQF